MIVPILAVCSPFLFTSRVLLADDFRDYFGPHAEMARQEFRESGELPRWNPYQYAGVPYVGAGQNNFYYPPMLLLLLLPAGRGLSILAALHLLLAAAGMYRLARSYGLRRESAVVSGLAFGLSFCLIARLSAGHLPNFFTVCQAPVLLLLVRRAALRPDFFRFASLAGGGALVLLAGSPQFVYQLGLLCAALATTELAWRFRRGEAVAPALGLMAGAFVAALALSAVHLLPLIETATDSNRAAAEELVQPFHDFTLTQLAMLAVPRFFWHPVSDPWLGHEKALYLGLLPLILAAGAFRRRARGPVYFFGAVALVALLEALTGFLLAWLPWYGGFRIPERIVWMI
ncbi:MAG: hypothetical protein JO332_15120, partial [Planctomycetaceae bacterium]|nr:hypothetical protein [Planctomycetaceae bacterium]